MRNKYVSHLKMAIDALNTESIPGALYYYGIEAPIELLLLKRGLMGLSKSTKLGNINDKIFLRIR